MRGNKSTFPIILLILLYGMVVYLDSFVYGRLLGAWRVELSGLWVRRSSSNLLGKLHLDHPSSYYFSMHVVIYITLLYYACVGILW